MWAVPVPAFPGYVLVTSPAHLNRASEATRENVRSGEAGPGQGCDPGE